MVSTAKRRVIVVDGSPDMAFSTAQLLKLADFGAKAVLIGRPHAHRLKAPQAGACPFFGVVICSSIETTSGGTSGVSWLCLATHGKPSAGGASP